MPSDILILPQSKLVLVMIKNIDELARAINDNNIILRKSLVFSFIEQTMYVIAKIHKNKYFGYSVHELTKTTPVFFFINSKLLFISLRLPILF